MLAIPEPSVNDSCHAFCGGSRRIRVTLRPADRKVPLAASLGDTSPTRMHRGEGRAGGQPSPRRLIGLDRVRAKAAGPGERLLARLSSCTTLGCYPDVTTVSAVAGAPLPIGHALKLCSVENIASETTVGQARSICHHSPRVCLTRVEPGVRRPASQVGVEDTRHLRRT